MIKSTFYWFALPLSFAMNSAEAFDDDDDDDDDDDEHVDVL